MYKIMTKLHTLKEGIYAFHMVTNDKGERVEYGVATEGEAAEKALELLQRVGYADLRIVNDIPYYLDLVYGIKPVPTPNLYKLELITPEGCTVNPTLIEDIEEGATVRTNITFDVKPDAFHLIIDEKEYKTGLPAWVTYDVIDEVSGTLSFSGITRDHIVEIVIDTIVA